MKDQQDPSDDEFDPASDSSSSEVLPDSGQIGYVQRPSSIGPDSPRRLDVAEDSPLLSVVRVLGLSTSVQLAELRSIAGAFLAEAVERLNLRPNVDEHISEYATFDETLERFLAADETEMSAQFGTDFDLAPVSSESALQEALDSRPDFPGFRLGQTFDRWVHRLAEIEDVAELSAVLGSTSGQTFGKIVTAVTIVHGLPRFLARCNAGEFTIEHVNAAARTAKDLPFESLPELDEYLGQRRADVTIDTFRKSLSMKAASMQDEDDRSELASQRRRVSITTYKDGTASVVLSGPAAELKAFHQRLEAFARAIRNGNIASLVATDVNDVDVSELGSIDSLMYDIATRVTPQLTIEVTANDTQNGTTTVNQIPLDLPDHGVPTAAAIVNTVNTAADEAQAEAELAAATAGETVESGGGDVDRTVGSAKVSTVIKMVMPTHGQWIREQAKLLVTVPFLTLAGESQLPGIYSDGSPIPATVARAIAGECSTWTRIMTDPVTGTPLDARSQNYRIPTDVRLPLAAKWQACSVPGCARRAETSELDHIIPFDHDDPEAGGQTTFENGHYLCRAHHQAKTDRKFSIRKTSDGSVEYVFAHGVTTEAMPPDNPINARHAELFAENGKPPDSRQNRPDPPPRPSSDPPPKPAPGPAPVVPSTPGCPALGRPRKQPAPSGGANDRGSPRANDRPDRARRRNQMRKDQNQQRRDQGSRVSGTGEAVDPWSGQRPANINWDACEPPPF